MNSENDARGHHVALYPTALTPRLSLFDYAYHSTWYWTLRTAANAPKPSFVHLVLQFAINTLCSILLKP